jgi:hypothetical protein
MPLQTQTSIIVLAQDLVVKPVLDPVAGMREQEEFDHFLTRLPVMAAKVKPIAIPNAHMN